MSNEFKQWMDARRLRAIDVADALSVSTSVVYGWRHHGVCGKWIEPVERYMKMYDEPRHDLADALMDAIKRVHDITSGVVVGK